jgi:hypothetical protein
VSDNGGLSFVSPTELVDLPSQGKFYPEGHPLHNQESIEIREMTAKEEDILTSKSLIQKGVVFDKLLQSLIVNSMIGPHQLLIGDKNALLIAARRSGYGEMYETSVNCPSCGVQQDISFDLTDASIKGPPSLEASSDNVGTPITQTDSGTFLARLPKSNLDVELKLITGSDERKLAATLEMRKKKKLSENILTEHLRACIVSVAGNEDRQEIEKFINVMPARDSRFVRKVMTEVTPNIDLTQEFICEECYHEQDLEVPINATFFWPDK